MVIYDSDVVVVVTTLVVTDICTVVINAVVCSV